MEMGTRTQSALLFVLGIVIGAILTGAFYQHAVQVRSSVSTDVNAAAQTQQTVAFEPMRTVSRTVPVVAVDPTETAGVMGNLTVRLIPGSENVLVDTSPFTEPDLQESANIALLAAKNEVPGYLPTSDFILAYDMSEADVVGGGSAGAATAVAMVAALENKTIRPGVAMTGTIDENGTIGQIGGVVEKAKAAAAAGYKLFLVPMGQAQAVTYTQTIRQGTRRHGTFRYIREVPQTVSLQDIVNQTGMKVKEVGTLSDAEKEMLE